MKLMKPSKLVCESLSNVAKCLLIQVGCKIQILDEGMGLFKAENVFKGKKRWL
jgi:hypothetical protein